MCVEDTKAKFEFPVSRLLIDVLGVKKNKQIVSSLILRYA